MFFRDKVARQRLIDKMWDEVYYIRASAVSSHFSEDRDVKAKHDDLMKEIHKVRTEVEESDKKDGHAGYDFVNDWVALEDRVARLE